MNYAAIHRTMTRLGNRRLASLLRGFFKTGPGEYGEGDLFLGIKVPATRAVARQHRDLSLPVIRRLHRSPFHEERLLALLILVDRFERGDEADRRRIFTFYLGNTAWTNNWDLVDLSAPNIVGRHLLARSRQPLHHLARSRNLWERRIAIVATHAFIREHQFTDTLIIAQTLLNDTEDLIHKATGWMLREVGKRDQPTLEAFLKPNLLRIPRTALRYAIERFPEPLRKAYLLGKV